MNDIVAFLEARINEDEAVARSVNTPSPWKADTRGGHDRVEGDGWTVCTAGQTDVSHIARHDPARVLREVEAKRIIIGTLSGTIWGERTQSMIKALTEIYSDHPDYNEEWRV